MQLSLVPTPPGTGVIALTLFFTSSNITSPTKLDFIHFQHFILFIPTSIIIAPSFTQSLFTNSGFPIAATNISALLANIFNINRFRMNCCNGTRLF